MADLTEPDFDDEKTEPETEKEMEVPEEEASGELQLSTASEFSGKSEDAGSTASEETIDNEEASEQEADEDSDVVQVISDESEVDDEPETEMAGAETTIAMTPSSRKSMVSQFFEKEDEEGGFFVILWLNFNTYGTLSKFFPPF